MPETPDCSDTGASFVWCRPMESEEESETVTFPLLPDPLSPRSVGITCLPNGSQARVHLEGKSHCGSAGYARYLPFRVCERKLFFLSCLVVQESYLPSAALNEDVEIERKVRCVWICPRGSVR